MFKFAIKKKKKKKKKLMVFKMPCFFYICFGEIVNMQEIDTGNVEKRKKYTITSHFKQSENNDKKDSCKNLINK